jgi:hypothetical protein
MEEGVSSSVRLIRPKGSLSTGLALGPAKYPNVADFSRGSTL